MKIERLLTKFVLIVSVALFGGPASYGKGRDDEVLREISTRGPDQVRFLYKFPGPLKYAEIVYEFSAASHSLEVVNINFGNGKRVNVPSSVLKCLANPDVEHAFFLFQQPDNRYPAASDNWWASVNLPFGEPPVSLSEGNAPTFSMHVYPYAEFQIVNWKVDRVLIQTSSHKSYVLQVPPMVCPDLKGN